MGSTAGCAVRDHPLYSSLHRDATNAARIRHDRRPPDRGRGLDAGLLREHACRRVRRRRARRGGLGSEISASATSPSSPRAGAEARPPTRAPTSRPTTSSPSTAGWRTAHACWPRICSPAAACTATLPCVKPNTRPRRSTASSSWACRFPAIGSAGSRLSDRSRRARPRDVGWAPDLAADGRRAFEGVVARGVPLFQPWQVVSLLTAADGSRTA